MGTGRVRVRVRVRMRVRARARVRVRVRVRARVTDDVEGSDGRVRGGRVRQGHHQIEVLADQAGGLCS